MMPDLIFYALEVWVFKRERFNGCYRQGVPMGALRTSQPYALPHFS
jgi:hypothetical protein